MREEIIKHVFEKKLIAIVRGADPEKILPLGEALAAGGIDMMEVTFDQREEGGFLSTRRSIERLAKELSGRVYVGSGTVLTKEQVDMTAESGGQYIITPSTDAEVISYARSKGLVTMPGAMTPSEIVTAFQAGADFVKVFPASVLGPSYIKALKGPLPHIPLMAVGGISEKNIPDFLKAGVCGFGIGGNLAKKELIEAGEFGRITELAKEYVRALEA